MTGRAPADPVVHVSSVREAVGALAAAGDRGEPLAGGTWVMRAGLRGEPRKDVHVALARVAELQGIAVDGEVRAGALVTHAELADAGLGAALGAIGDAAAGSAFPSVRNVATLGGNLAARPFPEADLVPALLACEACVRLAGPGGEVSLPLPEYLRTRGRRPAGELIVGVVVPAPARRRSAYERLTIRGGGEYPVAAVAVSVDLGDDGAVRAARVALGSVEDVARLSQAGAAAIVGHPLGDEAAERCGRAAAGEASPREGRDAPAWYRAAVLPALARRAIGRLRP